MEFEVFTGECELLQDSIEVFAAHRLKSRWRLETRNMALDANGVRSGLYDQVTIEYLDEDRLCTVTDRMSGFAQSGLDGIMVSET